MLAQPEDRSPALVAAPFVGLEQRSNDRVGIGSGCLGHPLEPTLFRFDR
jgi:hypothetical protein